MTLTDTEDDISRVYPANCRICKLTPITVMLLILVPKTTGRHKADDYERISTFGLSP